MAPYLKSQARASYILRESSYPFLALVVLKRSRLVVCERVEGSLSVETLIQRLKAAITSNEAELVVERNERWVKLVYARFRVCLKWTCMLLCKMRPVYTLVE